MLKVIIIESIEKSIDLFHFFTIMGFRAYRFRFNVRSEVFKTSTPIKENMNITYNENIYINKFTVRLLNNKARGRVADVCRPLTTGHHY